MKRSVLACIALLLVISQSGCDTVDAGPGTLKIHLQNNFYGERVRIEIDGEEVFNKSVVTDFRLSFAEAFHLERPRGEHRIRVVVADSASKEQLFVLQDELFIGVRYYPVAIPDVDIEPGIVIEQTRTPYLYY